MTVLANGGVAPLSRNENNRSSIDFRWEAALVWPTVAMDDQSDKEIANKKQRERMLKLVSKGFYNELINYGVRKAEIVSVASNLLGNLLGEEKKPAKDVE